MAHVIEHENHLAVDLKNDRERRWRKAKQGMKVLGYALAVLVIISVVWRIWSSTMLLTLTEADGLVVTLAFFYTVVQLLAMVTGNSITRSGLDGENRTRDVLSALPDDYTVLQDLTIDVDGKESQIDSVVVGPTGVFVIETKNHNGTIHGTEADKEFYQRKIGRRGTPYGKYFYSPVKQVGTHVWRLSQFLKQKNLDTWVQGAVFFSNPTARVDVESKKIPVFSYRDGYHELLHYITTSSGRPLSRERQEEIVKLIAATIPNPS